MHNEVQDAVHILHVDDSREDREFVAGVLAAPVVRVAGFSSLRQLSEQVDRLARPNRGFDVAILDVRFAGRSRLRQLLEFVRHRLAVGEVIVLSNYADDPAVRAASVDDEKSRVLMLNKASLIHDEGRVLREMVLKCLSSSNSSDVRSILEDLWAGRKEARLARYAAGVERLFDEYDQLIRSSPHERELQRFLSEYEFFWAFLGGTILLRKPRLLSSKEADFGVVGAGGRLTLIEIEKPQTRLARADGRQSAELQAGVDQINDWRIIVENDRRALVDQLGLRCDDVQAIDFVLVAGLRETTDPLALRAVRNGMAADTRFLTFDELGNQARRAFWSYARLQRELK